MPTYTSGRLALGIALAASCISPHALSGTVNLMTPDRGSCSFESPEEGSGLTYYYPVDSPSYTCFPSKVRSIQFKGLPSALDIILTSNRNCTKETANPYDYWLHFRTIATKTTDERIWSFEELQKDEPGTTRARGLKLIDKKAISADDMRDSTRCIMLSASESIDTPLIGDALKLSSVQHTPSQSEQDGPNERACPRNHFIIARYHAGNHKSGTFYTCGTVDGYTTHSPQWSPQFRESGLSPESRESGLEKEDTQVTANNKSYIYFTCPVHTVMTARWHDGDENGDTKYQCSGLVSSQGLAVNVEPGTWSPEHKESSTTFEICPPNNVMIGRAHKNDENGLTRYLCGTLRPFVATGAK